jgi:hypothetical protein
MKFYLNKQKTLLVVLLLILWALASLYILTRMHGWHWISFKYEKPKNIAQVAKDIEKENWGMIHVLGRGCGCSEFVQDYLIKRKAQKNIRETIIFIGNAARKRELEKAGYHFAEAQNVNGLIKGVPMLLIYNNNGQVIYSGGYAQKTITPFTQIQDLKILQAAKSEQNLKEYSVMGCAVSKKLQNLLDPLNLKYSEEISYVK